MQTALVNYKKKIVFVPQYCGHLSCCSLFEDCCFRCVLTDCSNVPYSDVQIYIQLEVTFSLSLRMLFGSFFWCLKNFKSLHNIHFVLLLNTIYRFILIVIMELVDNVDCFTNDHTVELINWSRMQDADSVLLLLIRNTIYRFILVVPMELVGKVDCFINDHIVELINCNRMQDAESVFLLLIRDTIYSFFLGVTEIVR